MAKFPSYMVMTFFLVFFTGCGHLLQKTDDRPTPVAREKTTSHASQAKKTVNSTTAVWYLFSESQISLYLKNLDDASGATMIIQSGLTELSLDVGHWEITGFEENGNSFTSMNTSKKFVFRVKPDTHNYAGSIVIGCPKVSSDSFKYLKAMKYFDRYPFSSSAKLCEMIVGNDFAFVRNQFRKSHKNKGLKLSLGF